MTRGLIADDSSTVLEVFSGMLKSPPDIEVVGLASDGLQAVERAHELLPDIVMMDVQMPNMDGLEAARRIKQAFPSVGVLIISGSAIHEEASIAMGADGFLPKPCDRTELICRLRQIAAMYEEQASS